MATEEEQESNKRAALAGQWRTPPLPVFANNGQPLAPGADGTAAAPPAVAPAASHDSNATATTTASAMTLPDNVTSGAEAPEKLPASTEDYVKALQEAYLRGAEAAAAMAAKQGGGANNVPTAVSCPDFAHVAKPAGAPPAAAAAQTAPVAAAQAPILPHGAPAGGAVVPNPLVGSSSSTAATHPATDSTMPPPPRVTVVSSATVAPPAEVSTAPPTAPPVTHVAQPPPPPQQQQHVSHLHHAPPPPQQQQQQVAAPPPPQQAAAAPPPPQGQPQQQQQPSRSMSLPDMASYAAQQEEEKRRKRLARNRTSARLRRLRKKNLVDAYETEVGILEKTLAKLNAHEWGQPQAAPSGTAPNPAATNALVEALGMDRGQQELGPAERKRAAADTLQQQLRFVEQLEELMQEQYLLYQLAAASNTADCAINAEFQDLLQTLQLTPQQIQHLRESSTGWLEEWTALQTVKESLQALQTNEWLWNDGVADVVDKFMGILHKPQITKFLLWADNNVDAIDELDMVHAYKGVPTGPVFNFGSDSHTAAAAAQQQAQAQQQQQQAVAAVDPAVAAAMPWMAK